MPSSEEAFLLRHRTWLVLVLGTWLGLAAGVLRGLLAVHRSGDWSQGTPWLAWTRLARTAVLPGWSGVALGLLAALLLTFAARARRIPPRPAPRAAVPALVLGLAILGLSSAWIPLDPLVGTLRAGRRPSVVLVSIDTLRADRLLDEAGTRLMPRVRGFVDAGTTFTQASAAAPWTLPSHASLFSSLLPFDHRAQWTSAPVRPRRLLLAELFREAGYRTGAFTGAVYVGAEFGFGQGFQVYEDHDEHEEGGSHAIFANALAFARRHRDVPFFLFVHTYEVHFPYYASPETGAPVGRLGPVFTTDACEAIYRNDLVLSPEERRYVEALYDSDVRSADRAIGGFLDDLQRDGILDDVILVVLSDHGEDLWDHYEGRSPGHGHSLYQEMVRVPLAFRAPGRVGTGVRLSTPVSLLDVAPTLLDLCGLPPSELHQGRTLASSLRTGEEPPVHPILAESIEFGPDRFALREGSLKVIFAPHPERFHHDVRLDVRPVEIFDLSADPGERDPHSGRHLAFLDRLNVLVDRARRVLRPGARDGNGTHRLSREVEEQLRSLGYVD